MRGRSGWEWCGAALLAVLSLAGDVEGEEPPAAERQTLVYKRVGELAIRADVFARPGDSPRPVVVWLHGGALINGHRESVPAWLLDACRRQEWHMVSLDYRLAPETQLPAILDDVVDGFRWIRADGPKEFHADPERVAVVGGSAGGYLTLVAGQRVTPPPVALVSLWGYGELVGPWYSQPSPHPRHHTSKLSREEAYRQVSGPPVSDSRDRQGDGGAFYQYCRQQGLWPRAVTGWDPIGEAERFRPLMPLVNVTPRFPPTLLIHGTADTDVPFAESEQMAAALAAQHVPHRLLRVEGAEHGLASASAERIAETQSAAVEFLAERLAFAASAPADDVGRAEEARVVVVDSPDELRAALAELRDGTTLRIAPGEYPGGWRVSGRARVTIEGQDRERPPVFRGGSVAWHCSRCPGLTLRDLQVRGQSGNGINIDDGGESSPVKGVTIARVEVADIGPRGNHDGLKCSGVDNLVIEDCSIVGCSGQGMDLVGCHQVRIRGCRVQGREGVAMTAGVQLKGGSADVVVEQCRFQDAGERPLNIGGSTGADYFRPRDARREAGDVVVRDNIIEGGLCAAAFVGVNGAQFRDNTILFPGKWVFRVLQENNSPNMAPSGHVVIQDNRIVFRRSQVQVEVNIGPGTAPETIRFQGNQWFAEDQPTRSRPRLPTPEEQGRYGEDPRDR